MIRVCKRAQLITHKSLGLSPARLASNYRLSRGQGLQRNITHSSNSYSTLQETKAINKMHIEQADVVSQVIMAPARPELGPNKTIFLAGNTTPTGGPDWRETLCERLAENPITIFNPKRDDWDSTWREDFSDPRWAEQVNWELDMQDRADIVVFVFHGVSVAPISLLELGLAARSGKAVVCLLEGYSKAGNVEAICQRYGLLLIRHEIFLRACIIAKLVSDE